MEVGAAPVVSSGPPVGVRTLAPGGMPLLVADLPVSDAARRIRAALVMAGLLPLPGFVGIDFPRGARVGVQLEGQVVRLVDEQDADLLRLTREGLSAAWLESAVRLRGTMLAVVSGVGLDRFTDERVLSEALDTAARSGGMLGAIVGVHDQRMRLPLLG